MGGIDCAWISGGAGRGIEGTTGVLACGVDLWMSAGMPSPEVEGEAGQGEGQRVAGSGEVAHAVEAVPSLEGAEDRFHGPALEREGVIARDRLGRERLVAFPPAQNAAGDAASLEMIAHASGIISAIGIDRVLVTL